MIDFAATPYFLDDAGGTPLTEPNVVEGQLAVNETAILFRDGITGENMQEAWGDHNYLAIDRWPALNNGGDLIAIWSDADRYALDNVGDERTSVEASAAVTYQAGDAGWPRSSQGKSIHVVSVADGHDDAANWLLSAADDGDSVAATAIIASLPDHAGGDWGTPGSFGDGTVVPPATTLTLDTNGDGVVGASDLPQFCASVAGTGSMAAALSEAGLMAGDLNLDGAVSFPDFLLLSANFASTGGYGEGDIDCDGAIGFSDFLAMSANFGKSTAQGSLGMESVPEPGACCLVCSTFLLLLVMRRTATRVTSVCPTAPSTLR